MRFGINQFCWPSGVDVADAVVRSSGLGFQCFEACYTLDDRQSVAGGGVTDALGISAYYNRLLNCNSTDDDIRELGKIADAAGLKIGSIGGIVSFSIYPLTSADNSVAKKSERAIKRMIDAAGILGADTVLVIPGFLDDTMEYAAGYALAQQRVDKLAEYAGAINLGIENVWNNMLYSPLEMNRFVDELGRDNVGIYFDVANARRFGYPQQWIRTLGRRIKKVHVKDYRMSIDNINAFTNLLDGDVDYPAVLKALKEIHYDGDLIVELTPPSRYFVEKSLEHALQVLKELSA